MAMKIKDLNEDCRARQQRYEPWSQRAEDLETKLTNLKPRLG
jgi:hypothetical protein